MWDVAKKQRGHTRLNIKEVNIEILNHFTFTKFANSNLKKEEGSKREREIVHEKQ